MTDRWDDMPEDCHAMMIAMDQILEHEALDQAAKLAGAKF